MRSFIATAACLVALCNSPAVAQEASSQESVRIETDQKAKAFIFIIDDEPVALLDKNGLSVVEHISYGGMLTDKGRDGARRDIETTLGGTADDTDE